MLLTKTMVAMFFIGEKVLPRLHDRSLPPCDRATNKPVLPPQQAPADLRFVLVCRF